jgi:SAM-dependent methyltransferase
MSGSTSTSRGKRGRRGRPSSVELFADPELSGRFLDHYETLRGKVRREIVRRHLQEVVLDSATWPLRVVDVGCGDGQDAIWLAAKGHDVLAVDTSPAMVERANENLAQAPDELSVTFSEGDVLSVLESDGESAFDLVLSHGVIMYQEDPGSFVALHLRLVKDMGMLSLLAKNTAGFVYRAAKEASVDEAMQALDDSRGLGHLGVSTGGQSIHEIASYGHEGGATVRSWAGVRIFSDSPTDVLIEEDDAKVIEFEWRAARRDPYRQTAALLHVLQLKGLDLSLLPF